MLQSFVTREDLFVLSLSWLPTPRRVVNTAIWKSKSSRRAAASLLCFTPLRIQTAFSFTSFTDAPVLPSLLVSRVLQGVFEPSLVSVHSLWEAPPSLCSEVLFWRLLWSLLQMTSRLVFTRCQHVITSHLFPWFWAGEMAQHCPILPEFNCHHSCGADSAAAGDLPPVASSGTCTYRHLHPPKYPQCVHN